jgi:hypothetical protein
VVYLPLELLDALIGRDVSLCSKASSNNEESCLGLSSVCSFDCPFDGVLIKLAIGDNCFKGGVFAKVADFVHVVEVCLQLAPIRVVACECPCLVNLRDVELVDWDWAVDSCTGIAIPSPKICQVSREVV